MSPIKELVASTLAELIDYAAAYTAGKRCAIWFRGNANCDWDLRPKVFRPEVCGATPLQEYETSLVRNFERQAHMRASGCPAAEDNAAWLSLMQHHGLPTRLLDWSDSVLVAAFFATEDTQARGDAAVWSLDPMRLNEHQLGGKEILTPDDLPGRLACYLPFAYGKVLGDEGVQRLATKLASATVAMELKEANLRMLLQHSRFTIHGNATPIQQQPGASDFLLRIRIPADSRREIFEKLAFCGFRRNTLFPDLDNLAGWLQGYARTDW